MSPVQTAPRVMAAPGEAESETTPAPELPRPGLLGFSQLAINQTKLTPRTTEGSPGDY